MVSKRITRISYSEKDRSVCVVTVGNIYIILTYLHMFVITFTVEIVVLQEFVRTINYVQSDHSKKREVPIVDIISIFFVFIA